MRVLRWGLLALVPLGMFAFAFWLLDDGGAPRELAASGIAGSGAGETTDHERSESGADRDRAGSGAKLGVDRAEEEIPSEAGAETGTSSEAGSTDSRLRAVVGRVVDADRKPLADVAVQPFVRWRRDLELEAATTDAEGNFRLGLDPSKGELWLRAQPADLVWVEVPVPSGPVGEVAKVGDLVCEVGATLVGRVVDLDGRAVREAEVSAWSRKNSSDGAEIFFGYAGSGGVVRKTTSDRTGRFEILGMAEGMGSVRAVASGLQPSTVQDVVLTPAETSAEVKVTLEPGLRIAGVVVDGSGQPLEGARVRAQFSNWNVEDMVAQTTPPEATSDELGRFEFASMSDRSVNLDVSLAGYLPFRKEQLAAPADLRVELQAASVVVGRVQAGADLPIGEYTLEVRETQFSRSPGDDREPEVLLGTDAVSHLPDGTDPEGCFAVLAARSRSLWLTITADGYSQARVGPVSTAPDSAHFVEVELVAAAGLSGIVRDPDGNPVEGASVQIARPRGNRSEGLRSMGFARESRGSPAEVTTRYEAAKAQVDTAADGSYALQGIPTGTYELTASHRSFVKSEPAEVVFEDEAPPPGPVDLELRAGGTLVGRTFDALGDRLAAAMVRVNKAKPAGSGGDEDFFFFGGNAHRNATSDGEGNYRIEGLEVGEYRAYVEEARSGDMGLVYARANRQSQRGTPFAVEIGEVVELDLSLEQKSSLEVFVTDGSRGVAGARVRVTRPGRPSFSPFNSAPVTDAEGRCRIDELSQGDVVLVVEPPGGAPAMKQDHRVVTGTEDSVTVALPGAVVSGRVVDGAGGGVEGATVRLAPEEGGSDRDGMAGVFVNLAGGRGGGATNRGSTDADGHFQIPYVSAGKFQLSVSHDEILPVDAVEVEVEAGRGPKPVSVDVARAAVLEVHLENASRQRTKLTLTSFERSDDIRTKNPWGGQKVRFTGVPPGRYDLRVEAGSKGWSGTVDVEAGENTVTAELR